MPKAKKLQGNKYDRMIVLEKRYLDLHFMKTDEDRFRELCKQYKGETSMRTLKQYKKEGKWGIKMALLLAEKQKMGEGVISTNKRKKAKDSFVKVQRTVYTPEEHEQEEPAEEKKVNVGIVRTDHEATSIPMDIKEQLVRDICEDYEKGFDLTEICLRHGIHHNTFASFVAENPVLEQIFRESKIRHEMSFMLLFQEKLKNRILSQIEKEFIVEEVVHFKIDYSPDKDGKITGKRRDTHGSKRKIPNRIDSKTIEMFQAIIKAMTSNIERARELSTDKFSRYDTEELRMLLEEIDKKLSNDNELTDYEEFRGDI